MPLAGSVIYIEKKSCIRCASVLQTNTSTSFSPAFTAFVISQRYGRQMRCPHVLAVYEQLCRYADVFKFKLYVCRIV